jgi:hypothetical protein
MEATNENGISDKTHLIAYIKSDIEDKKRLIKKYKDETNSLFLNRVQRYRKKIMYQLIEEVKLLESQIKQLTQESPTENPSPKPPSDQQQSVESPLHQPSEESLSREKYDIRPAEPAGGGKKKSNKKRRTAKKSRKARKSRRIKK